MSLDELAKKAIYEINSQISKQEKQETSEEESEEVLVKEENKEISIEEKEELKIEELAEKEPQEVLEESRSIKPQIEELPSKIPEDAEIIDFTQPYKNKQDEEANYILSTNEELFLNKLKERILVLFEGLKSTKHEDLEIRLDLTINFLEFLLASIEDKLKK
ncbi:CiaD-like domain-containing protein [Campylobacter troglodytis]|uniref:CiaD-like domain-containing protein n=1 Tax=Campylobacter troglodytis TaxID=654363 RepID=UPI0011572A3F|nr:2-oxoglutarate:acceptor oxidoreductase [Campylobacter troglodytis]TQR60956.1 2-oxoglutarate:acceptor oxidoreductase [Campylobacter troglodytis]